MSVSWPFGGASVSAAVACYVVGRYHDRCWHAIRGVIRSVRDRGFTARELPAIALTAFARAEDRRRVLLAGFQVHVPKPVDPGVLTRLLDTLAARGGR